MSDSMGEPEHIGSVVKRVLADMTDQQQRAVHDVAHVFPGSRLLIQGHSVRVRLNPRTDCACCMKTLEKSLAAK